MGKTWLLQYLCLVAPYEFGSRYRVCYINAEDNSLQTRSDFVRHCALGLDPELRLQSHTSLDLIFFTNLVQSIKAKRNELVLCIDNLEALGNKRDNQGFDDNFYEGLRAIAGGYKLAIITTSKTPLAQFAHYISSTSPFFNIFEETILAPFTLKEARQLLLSKLTLSENELETLLEITKGVPLKLQLAGQLLLEKETLKDSSETMLWVKERINIANL
jgi:hypothetical protein